ncbi:MAG: hypothetical protein LBL92_06085 [Propionibacteriaceae bacterium]|nr:hypothetical protein [Propionibacteriaceae bacterium]
MIWGLLVGAVVVGLVIIVAAGLFLRRAGRQLMADVGQRLDQMTARASWLDRIGQANPWSRPPGWEMTRSSADPIRSGQTQDSQVR